VKKFALLLLLAVLPVQAQELKPWPGVITPALSLSDLEGKPHKLADYRGKVVLVNFWATWCVPCREEMPSLDRLQAAFIGQPPHGQLQGPSPQLAAQKAEFGQTRVQRWFGRDGG